MGGRTAKIDRRTREVSIRGSLHLDGSGRFVISTGIRFLDHMLELFAKHGLFDLQLKAKGDLDVDLHHTNEDLGLALGEAFRAALGEKRGVHRFGAGHELQKRNHPPDAAYVPMDESLARVVVDLSGRPHFQWDWVAREKEAMFRRDRALRLKKNSLPRWTYGVEDAKHFLESFVRKAEITLHVDILKAGVDVHHVLEAVFKALGLALRHAVERDPRVKGVPSTKGRL